MKQTPYASPIFEYSTPCGHLSEVQELARPRATFARLCCVARAWNVMVLEAYSGCPTLRWITMICYRQARSAEFSSCRGNSNEPLYTNLRYRYASCFGVLAQLIQIGSLRPRYTRVRFIIIIIIIIIVISFFLSFIVLSLITLLTVLL